MNIVRDVTPKPLPQLGAFVPGVIFDMPDSADPDYVYYKLNRSCDCLCLSIDQRTNLAPSTQIRLLEAELHVRSKP